MDPQKITELANLLRQNGDKILSSEFTLTLSGSLLRALNDSFTLIADTEIVAGAGAGTHTTHHHHHQQHQQQTIFQVVKPINAKSSVFPDLQLLHDFVQKTTLLKLTYFPSELYFEGAIDIAKFRALRRLEVHKININQVVGIQPFRGQLQHLICVKSLASVDDIITRCGGDNSNGFVWNELQTADFSYNSLRSVDTALEFAQHLQHLNLRHNKLISVAAIKWLPHLKTLDLSYNCLTYLPQFHMEACKKLQQLNISNNYVEELLDVAKLDALTSLDLTDNCLLEHSQLLPLSALMTLTMLNLQGNPLSCNPKHRQATAIYLHKNTASVKFVLDFEPLSKAEKALTGSQKWRYIGSHRGQRSGPVSINSSSTSINTCDGSQFSSFSSLNTEQMTSLDTSQSSKKQNSKKSLSKIRRADISEDTDDVAEAAAVLPPPKPQTEGEECSTDSGHLETKKQIETLRLTYGNEWLKTGNAELMLGIESPQPSEKERNASRQQFNEFLGEFSAPMPAKKDPQGNLNVSSTPTNNSSTWGASFDNTLTPIKSETQETQETANQTLYETCDESGETQYESIISSTKEQSEEKDQTEKKEQEEQGHSQDKHKNLLSLYASGSNAVEEEDPVSDMEPDEETYIVYLEHKPSVPLFLTISSNFIREKDTLSERTKTKWSLKILESCERLKSNTLRINFDTLRKDKQERIYCVENTLCQELEKKLRDILSQRDLTEMNIKIYRCVNCLIQFSMEQKIKRYRTEQLRCPDCRSVHVAEVTDLSTSLDKPSVEVAAEPKLSPALIVEESPAMGASPNKEETNSIVALSRLKTTAKNTPKRRSLMQATKSSANSLNESSSCSKITNSQSSFDSNQSVVGSSNTDRDLEFRANESDVDIISNPSQSSIEVLDPNCVQSASRKTSEDRRISQLPHLQALHDETQSFIEREFGQQMRQEEAAAAAAAAAAVAPTPPPAVSQVQLTESSSSGSVTDSICTTYEQQKEGAKESSNNNHLKKVEELPVLPFASVFQSTNLLMSSSKKLIDSEASSGSTSSGMHPYKFNYSNFNDIDHRLKLYFYQTKFKEQDEHFKWLAKGWIYNEQTQTLTEGLVVMSTCKLYLMEAFGAPHDDVSKWLRQLISVTVDRLVSIGVLPWKLGLSFSLRDWGGFVLLLHDMLRTDSLLLYMQENALPSQCQVLQQSSAVLKSVSSEPVKMCAILASCHWSCNEEKGLSFEPCLLLTTDSHLYISGNGKWDWLSAKTQESALEPSLTQPMSNLVDVERLSDVEYVINFIDETENKCEMWKLNFETYANAECCLNAVGQTWEQLFGVPFSYSGT
ncbi:serine/threonine-protein kinase 11-interacting protein isoform X1 [Drosophila miranda]|uniref:serine/threonine-protein kinase 11-interacting protein isoform X1 n=1 Tax=Drosophila miranda TaxID=7229 RepID=UPI0007E70435|nr:serine/threonine-protein kinase 11-interacting protein isoform X1 [Drosophila miranda]